MKVYGWFGLFLILFIKSVRIMSVRFVALRSIDLIIGQWFTPLVWWGYILFADGFVSAQRGRGWFKSYRRELVYMLVTSNLCWIIFEGYNQFLRNWEYHGLSPYWWEDGLGRLLAYATIFPGIFLTASILDILFKPALSVKQIPTTKRTRIFWTVIGLIFLIYPIVFPSPYLFGFVWVGFIFFLDPINETLGGRSLFAEIKAKNYTFTLLLLFSGYICGFLWEHWNSWADAKWIYTLPFPTIFKIYEMPLLGFFGFGPFALECYVMYEFLRLFARQYIPSIHQAQDVVFLRFR